MFIKYSTRLIPPKKSRGKGSQRKKNADTPEATVDVSEESDSEPAKKGTANRRVIKKTVSIYADDNIIPEPDVSLELGKSISLTKAAEEEAARQVHATHERIMIESNPEHARRRPSGIAFRDTSIVSKKDVSGLFRAKGVQTLTLEEQSVCLTWIPDEEKVTFEANVILEWGSEQESEYIEEDDDDEKIEWVDTDEEEEKNDDDDDKSIDLKKTYDEFVHSEEHAQDNDEETDDEFVHGDEQVNDDEDEEMTNAKDAGTGYGDEDIIDPWLIRPNERGF
ncbi:hypothetical protein Tco_0215146 [Tanacetum coccineum]